MKRLACIGLFAALLGTLLGTELGAETVLICHAQTLPAALQAGFQSEAAQNLVDMVFDSLFERGDIAFDTTLKDLGDDPSALWLAGLSQSYGADKVVYFRVFWKAGKTKEVLLDHVNYSLVGPKGYVLQTGTFTLPLTAASADEAKDTRSLGTELVKRLAL